MVDPAIFLLEYTIIKVLVELLLLVAAKEKLTGIFGVSPKV